MLSRDDREPLSRNMEAPMQHRTFLRSFRKWIRYHDVSGPLTAGPEEKCEWSSFLIILSRFLPDLEQYHQRRTRCIC